MNEFIPVGHRRLFQSSAESAADDCVRIMDVGPALPYVPIQSKFPIFPQADASSMFHYIRRVLASDYDADVILIWIENLLDANGRFWK